MPPAPDLKNQQFGNLLVKEISHRDRQVYWECLCSCGELTIVTTHHLRSGHTRSCGCLIKQNATVMGKANLKHGHTVNGKSSPTFESWESCADDVKIQRIELIEIWRPRH
jgi:hypothetical protein